MEDIFNYILLKSFLDKSDQNILLKQPISWTFPINHQSGLHSAVLQHDFEKGPSHDIEFTLVNDYCDKIKNIFRIIEEEYDGIKGIFWKY